MHRLLAQLTLPSDGGSVSVDNPVGFRYTTIGSVIDGAVPFVFVAAGFGLLLMLIAAGFSYLTSGGDAKKMQMAQQRLTHAILGFLIIFCAYWIVQLLGLVFNIREFQSIF